MMRVVTSSGLQTLPRKGSYWRHRNGNIYSVLSITNQSDRQDEYPTTVNYVGPNGKEWSKQVFNWFEKMTPLTDVVDLWVDMNIGQVLTPEKAAEFKSIWAAMMQQADDDKPKRFKPKE